MTGFDLAIYLLKFIIPTFFITFMFRVLGLGYKSKKRLIIGTVAFFAYIIIVPSIMMVVMGYSNFKTICNFVLIFSMLSVFIFTTDPPIKTIFLLFISSQISTASSIVLNMIRHICDLSYGTLVLILIVITPLILLLELKFLAKPLRYLVDNIHGDLYALIIIPACVLISVYLIPIYPAHNFTYHPIYCTVLIGLVEMIFFMFVYALYKNIQGLKVFLKIEHNAKQLEGEIVKYNEYLNYARQSRHDVRHHNNYVLECLNEGNISEAKSYLKTANANIEKQNLKRFSNNLVVNTVLRIYESEAERYGISFSALASVPDTLTISNPDLGTILSNVLENAVHSCNRAIELGDLAPYISFSATFDNDLRIEVNNTCIEPVTMSGNMPQSNRPDGGTGTKSIRDLVRNYGGMVRFHQKNDNFITQIISPLVLEDTSK
ncbi:MAG: GHKL domain-containing protein [Anaerovoracaceae bacterium]